MGMRNLRRRVAVVGAGMTRFVRRAQETGKELSFEASKMALESCELSLDQVDCVVHDILRRLRAGKPAALPGLGTLQPGKASTLRIKKTASDRPGAKR